jgi:hypothetical protein
VKLVKRVRSLEEKSRVKAGPQDAGIVWTSYEARIDPASLGDGEFLAADITIVESVGMWSRWRIKQRVSLDPSDRGIVYDAAGVRLGRVCCRSRRCALARRCRRLLAGGKECHHPNALPQSNHPPVMRAAAACWRRRAGQGERCSLAAHDVYRVMDHHCPLPIPLLLL